MYPHKNNGVNDFLIVFDEFLRDVRRKTLCPVCKGYENTRDLYWSKLSLGDDTYVQFVSGYACDCFLSGVSPPSFYS